MVTFAFQELFPPDCGVCLLGATRIEEVLALGTGAIQPYIQAAIDSGDENRAEYLHSLLPHAVSDTLILPADRRKDHYRDGEKVVTFIDRRDKLTLYHFSTLWVPGIAVVTSSGAKLQLEHYRDGIYEGNPLTPNCMTAAEYAYLHANPLYAEMWCKAYRATGYNPERMYDTIMTAPATVEVHGIRALVRTAARATM